MSESGHFTRRCGRAASSKRQANEVPQPAGMVKDAPQQLDAHMGIIRRCPPWLAGLRAKSWTFARERGQLVPVECTNLQQACLSVCGAALCRAQAQAQLNAARACLKGVVWTGSRLRGRYGKQDKWERLPSLQREAKIRRD